MTLAAILGLGGKVKKVKEISHTTSCGQFIVKMQMFSKRGSVYGE